jgi:hypothetical protein
MALARRVASLPMAVVLEKKKLLIHQQAQEFPADPMSLYHLHDCSSSTHPSLGRRAPPIPLEEGAFRHLVHHLVRGQVPLGLSRLAAVSDMTTLGLLVNTIVPVDVDVAPDAAADIRRSQSRNHSSRDRHPHHWWQS